MTEIKKEKPWFMTLGGTATVMVAVSIVMFILSFWLNNTYYRGYNSGYKQGAKEGIHASFDTVQKMLVYQIKNDSTVSKVTFEKDTLVYYLQTKTILDKIEKSKK